MAGADDEAIEVSIGDGAPSGSYSEIDFAGSRDGGGHRTGAEMNPDLSNVRVWFAVGRSDMRKGMNGLALRVQEAWGRDPRLPAIFTSSAAAAATW